MLIGASILAAVQMPTRRRFGDRMVERRLHESALLAQNIHEAKMEQAKTELENALNLPDGHKLASGNAELEQLFMTFCASGKGFAAKGKRGSSMDLTELQKLLTHLKILPAVKGGCGYVTKTKVSWIFKCVNRPGSHKSSGSIDSDKSELDFKEFMAALHLIGKSLGKLHPVQLLHLPPATTPPLESEGDAEAGGPAIPVRMQKTLAPKKRSEKFVAKEPVTIEELFTKFR